MFTLDQDHQNNYDHVSYSSSKMTELDHESNTITAMLNKQTESSEQTTLNSDGTRETWSNNFSYLITTLGGLIGLGEYF